MSIQTLSLITTRGSGEPTLAQLRRGRRRIVIAFEKPYPGMEQTVKLIKQLIDHYKDQSFVRQMALSLTKGIPKNGLSGLPNMRNNDAVADAIYDYIIRHDTYAHDPTGIERLQTPDATMQSGAGDCDDMAILSASLLESVVVPSRIRLIGKRPGRYSHIYIQYQDSGGRWKSFDPTLALYPGYQFNPALIKSSKIVPLSGRHSTFAT
jgi:hypothetical protein